MCLKLQFYQSKKLISNIIHVHFMSNYKFLTNRLVTFQVYANNSCTTKQFDLFRICLLFVMD